MIRLRLLTFIPKLNVIDTEKIDHINRCVGIVLVNDNRFVWHYHSPFINEYYIEHEQKSSMTQLHKANPINVCVRVVLMNRNQCLILCCMSFVVYIHV